MPIVLLLLLMAAAVPAPAQRDVIADNDYAKVLVVKDPPRGPGRMHEHPMNRVMIYLDQGKQRIRWQKGNVDDLALKPGLVLWSPAGGMHTSENNGTAAFRIVEVELKRPGRSFSFPAKDPLKVAPRNYKVILENSQVRVIEATAAPGEKLPLHEHSLPRVTIPLTPVAVEVTASDGSKTEAKMAEGEVRWALPATHSEKNVGTERFRVVVVEFK